MSHPADLDLTEASEALHAGALSAVELTEACLDRIARRDPAYGAWIRVYSDDARAEWCEICGHTSTHSGKGTSRLLHARRYLYQMLTGTHLPLGPHTLGFSSPTNRAGFLTFTTHLTLELRTPCTTTRTATCIGGRRRAPDLGTTHSPHSRPVAGRPRTHRH